MSQMVSVYRVSLGLVAANAVLKLKYLGWMFTTPVDYDLERAELSELLFLPQTKV